MKHILTLTTAGLVAVACSGGPTGPYQPAHLNPGAVFSLSLGPDATPILASADDSQTPFLVGEAWEYQEKENIFDQAQKYADRIEKNQPELVRIRQTRLIPEGGESPFRGLQDSGDCVDFAEQLRNALIDRGITYEVAGRQVETDLSVSMVRDGQPLLPLRLVVCTAEMSLFVMEFPPPQ
jgi:hypothetical protein